VLGFYNPNPASVVRTVWLDPRSRSAAASVDLHSQERQTLLLTSYSVSQPRFVEASVANALRALATLTAIITRLPLLKIERMNHLQHTLLSNALTPFAFQQVMSPESPLSALFWLPATALSWLPATYTTWLPATRCTLCKQLYIAIHRYKLCSQL